MPVLESKTVKVTVEALERFSGVGSGILPFEFSNSASQLETGESHSFIGRVSQHVSDAVAEPRRMA